jgi:hypothetical protein
MHPTVFVNNVDSTSGRLSQYEVWKVCAEKYRRQAKQWKRCIRLGESLLVKKPARL